MNLWGLREEFDRMNRTAGLTDFVALRDDWLNQGWQRISEIFVVPALNKTTTIDVVADQQEYDFPYDYNGTEVALSSSKRRLDPVPETTSELAFERRSRGLMRYYDWSSIVGEDELVVTDATVTNNSKVITTASTNAALNLAHWVRLDPKVDPTDSDLRVDPGDYGYQISAGTLTGGQFTLQKAYRGPTGTFTMRVRPAETQTFKVYGTPAAAETAGLTLKYSSKPRLLYNDADVPEWPNMGIPIAYMAISIALEWNHNIELSSTFFGRSNARINDLRKRRESSRALVSDVTIGSVSGRKTGMRSVYPSRIGR